MKKLIFIAITGAILSLVPLSLFAESKSSVEFDFKAGMTFTNVWGKNISSDIPWKPGFGGGLGVGYFFVSFLGLKGEVLYLQKGFDYQGEKWNIDYIEIPLTLVGKIPIPIVTPYFFAGPFLGIMVSASMASGDTLRPDTEPVDFGLTMGAGLAFGLPVGQITAELRYDISLTKYQKDAEKDSKFQCLIPMLGFSLNF